MLRSPAAANRPVAIVSHTLPGDLNGQGVMLDRLTAGTPEPGFVFIDTDRKAVPRAARSNWVACHPLPTPYILRKLFRFKQAQTRLYRALVHQRSQALASIVRRHDCQAIVACTGGDLVDLPAAVEAGRLTGLPTYLYYFDDYRVQWEILGGRWWQKVTTRLRDLAEPEVLRRAHAVFVPNETLADDVRTRTNTPVTIIRNPVDTAAYRELRSRFPRQPIDRSRQLKIVYTGSVYAAQADCLRRLCDAIDLLAAEGISLQLHIHGPQPCLETLSELPSDKISFHPPVSNAESAVIQVQADILFLPLSFTCEFPALIRTSAPGKFGEYLASGTPVLVHAPPNSFPVTFVKQHACATSCDVADSQALASTIRSMLANPQACEAMRHAAIDVAEHFAHTLNRDRFTSVFRSRQAQAA